MCIIKGIDQQDLQLSCSSWVREGGPSVPCGHLLSGSGPALSHSPALLGALGIAGTRVGQKALREGVLSEELHNKRRRLPWSVPLPSSIAVPEAPLGWG